MDVSLGTQLASILDAWRSQNLRYIEMMVDSADGPQLGEGELAQWDAQLLAAQDERDGDEAQALLGELHDVVTALPDWQAAVQANVDNQVR